MKVKRADNGLVITVFLAPEDKVSYLKQCLAEECPDMPIKDQILLFGKQKLEDDKTLKEYGINSKTEDVFLFDRKMLRPDAPPLPLTVLGPVELSVPSTKLSMQPSVPPDLWPVLQDFLDDLNYSKGVKGAVMDRIALCRRCCGEQDCMIQALKVAVANLKDHHSHLLQTYESFKRHFSAQQGKQQILLDEFESDLKKLKSTVLHPSLRTGTRVTLMDCVPDERRLVQWVVGCQKEHKQLMERAKELSAFVTELNNDVYDPTFLESSQLNINPLLEEINSLIQTREEILSIKASFAQDMKGAGEKLEAMQGEDRVSENDIWGWCEAMQEMRRAHLPLLSKLNMINTRSEKVMANCAVSKNQISVTMQTHLRRVSTLQSKIRNVQNKVIVFFEALNMQKQYFNQLYYIHNLSDAYHAALEEVKRRNVFSKNLSFSISAFLSILQKLREEELGKRDSFLKQHGRYIPKNLIPGLADTIPQFKNLISTSVDKNLVILNKEDNEGSEETKFQVLEDLITSFSTSKSGPLKPFGQTQNKATGDGKTIKLYKKKELAYQKRIQTLETRFGETANELDAIKNRFLQLEQENKMLTNKLQETQSINQQQQNDENFNSIKNENQMLSANLDLVNTDLAKIKTDKENLERENKELQSKISSMSKEFEEKEALLASLMEKEKKRSEKSPKKVDTEKQKMVFRQGKKVLQAYYTIQENKAKAMASMSLDRSASMGSFTRPSHSATLPSFGSFSSSSSSSSSSFSPSTSSTFDGNTSDGKNIENRTDKGKEKEVSTNNNSEDKNTQDMVKQLEELRKKLEKKKKQLKNMTYNNSHQEKKIHEARESFKRAVLDNEALKKELQNIERVCDELKGSIHLHRSSSEDQEQTIKRLEAELDELRLELQTYAENTKISFQKFKEGELALFLPVDKKVYKAFSCGDVNYYLSEESLEQVFSEEIKQKKEILGEIVYMSEEKAASNNPYQLPPGTTFYEVTASQF